MIDTNAQVGTSDFDAEAEAKARKWRFEEEQRLDEPVPFALRTPAEIDDEETAR